VREIAIIGAGPAGSTAALSALREGAAVRISERSRFPRHKVCGEFLTPESRQTLEGLGVWSDVLAARPAMMTRLTLAFGNSARTQMLPEPAYGVSRYAFDHLLLQAAIALGAQLVRESATHPQAPAILAMGRPAAAEPGSRESRLFGFKAHFGGPVSDAVELYFFRGCYVGVNPVEDDITNVCGLGPRRILAQYDFDIDEFVRSHEPLAERLAPLTRRFDWLHTGPLFFRNRLSHDGTPGIFPAGDALSFVDPFTGSGQWNAVLTGMLAGRFAARGQPVADYLAACRDVLRLPLFSATMVRRVLPTAAAGPLSRVIPAALLYRLTRPRSFG
jgi:menaquinone-9 beta-reductase